jgi:protein-S-isoprenylcysteine O-methyltransferase Ste14
MLGLPCSVLGLLLRGWAAGHLAKDRQLATSGPYAYIRNPLYLGTLITVVGLVIAAHNAGLGLLFALVFFLVYLPAVELEEQHLRTIFSAYAGYANHVNRFVPGRRCASGQQAFSMSLYLRNKEYKATLGWCIAVAWLVWKCWFARAA